MYSTKLLFCTLQFLLQETLFHSVGERSKKLGLCIMGAFFLKKKIEMRISNKKYAKRYFGTGQNQMDRKFYGPKPNG